MSVNVVSTGESRMAISLISVDQAFKAFLDTF